MSSKTVSDSLISPSSSSFSSLILLLPHWKCKSPSLPFMLRCHQRFPHYSPCTSCPPHRTLVNIIKFKNLKMPDLCGYIGGTIHDQHRIHRLDNSCHIITYIKNTFKKHFLRSRILSVSGIVIHFPLSLLLSVFRRPFLSLFLKSAHFTFHAKIKRKKLFLAKISTD